ncbi:MAG: hypothetical protein JW910_15475 [Anaerolineae bacterium]|nr:hypothetical protein [Anaerolineae bacterium]
MTLNNSSFKIQHSKFPEPPRGLLVPVVLGLVLVLAATVLMPWPSDVPGQPRALLVPHLDRLLHSNSSDVFVMDATGFSFAWTWRRIWDALHYLLIVAAAALITAAMLRRDPLPWVGLIAVGALGAGYTAGMVLYNGPLIATPGYLLILLPSLFAALTWHDNPVPQSTQSRKEDPEVL